MCSLSLQRVTKFDQHSKHFNTSMFVKKPCEMYTMASIVLPRNVLEISQMQIAVKKYVVFSEKLAQ